MATIYEKALEKHEQWKGKLSTELKSPLETRDDLSLAYTPGVAEPCRQIAKNPDDVYKYTWKGNTIAVVSDGTAVLGLGDIGPAAGLPVMEGKCVLFKKFAGLDAVPLCIDTKDPKKIIEFCKQIAPTFGGINLEDISAPRCVEIERTLIKELNIPVFHDDQHGTAIVVTAAVINALKVAQKKAEDCTVIVSGTGAAGSSIIRMLHQLGIKKIYGFNINGIVIKDDYDKYDFLTQELTQITNPDNRRITMAQAMVGADIFVGVSAPNLVTQEMVKSMATKSIIFAMANPEPEITYEKAKEAGAFIVGTGRSDYPNQINNILAFPGLFRGALDCRATKITEEMKIAASRGLASLVSQKELCPDKIIPDAFDERVAKTVAKAVSDEAKKAGLARL
ncbi:NAD(P)-dependent malic enzyme [Treponema pectinovorum]|uniref:NAD(P)-dependent malic enzyme n=1 Tax=Treponema pectinovorum TaxID=164 RepID=UPI0011F154AB|nr:malic enzyme-like NAD(P)-binding protein [Treponema pectinovorum]